MTMLVDYLPIENTNLIVLCISVAQVRFRHHIMYRCSPGDPHIDNTRACRPAETETGN